MPYETTHYLTTVLTRAEQSIRSKPNTYYRAGWFFCRPANPILFHSCSTSGFNNFVIAIPGQKFLLAYFSNKADNKTNAASVIKLLANASYPELADILVLHELTN